MSTRFFARHGRASFDKKLTRLSFLATKPFTYIEGGAKYELQPMTYYRRRPVAGRLVIERVI